MPKDPGAAVAIVGLSGFALLEAWNRNAPSLQECRSADCDDISIQQRLMDADYMVGGFAIALGIAYTYLTHDPSVLAMMVIGFAGISVWHHSVLEAEQR